MGQVKEYIGKVKPDWCPGCGDFAVLNALQRALAELDIAPHNVQVVSGIGCSSNLPGFINAYGFHGLHGRSLPVATGARLGNTDLTVIATGGDGDGYGIGVGHFVHTCRRNVNMTYIVMDNQVYGLTTGQASPTTEKDIRTKSTPEGTIEVALNLTRHSWTPSWLASFALGLWVIELVTDSQLLKAKLHFSRVDRCNHSR